MIRRSCSSGLDLPTTSKPDNCVLTKCAFNFLLVLKPIIANTFFSHHHMQESRVIFFWKSFWNAKILVVVILKIILFYFSWWLTFSKTIFSLQPLSNSYFVNWLHLLLKNSLFEQILLRLSTWLYGMPFLQ